MIDGLKVLFTGAELKEYARRYIKLINAQAFKEQKEREAEETNKTGPFGGWWLGRSESLFNYSEMLHRWQRLQMLEGWIGRLIDTEEYLLGEADMIKLGAFYLEKKPEAGTAGILPAGEEAT